MADEKSYEVQDRISFYQDYNRYAVLKAGYIFLMTTEETGFYKTGIEMTDFPGLFERGLEIRIFTEKQEAKWFRTGIDRKFRFRLRTDDLEDAFIWPESQYLDIDDARTEKREKREEEEHRVYATGGGNYTLPLGNYKNAKIKIHNYLEEDPDTGELYVKDWRLAGFEEVQVK